MATYYIRKTGSDSNAGTSAAAAWLTIGKALGSGSPVTGGDTIMVGAGTYRETVTMGITPGSTVNLTGDVDGKFTGDAGDVVWTSYTTNDKTAPAGAAPLTLNGNSNLTIDGFTMVGGSSASTGECVNGLTAGSTGITIRNCKLLPGRVSTTASLGLVAVAVAAGVNANWTVERCSMLAGFGPALYATLATHTSDYDAGITAQNCLFVAGNTSAIYVNATGAGSGKGGGVRVLSCQCVGSGKLLSTNSANLSTTNKCTAYYNVVLGGVGAALSANTSGQIQEDYNLLLASTARTNVSGGDAGANSISDNSYAPLVELYESSWLGRRIRDAFSPSVGSPLLGFVPSGSSPTPPSVDFTNRSRPSGGASLNYAAGCFEHHDSAAKETSTVDSGTAGISVTGPGDQDIRIPVDAAATVISIRARYDSTHGSTNKPQAILLADGELGVTAQTLTMSAAVDTWETLTFSSFTPTSRGVARVRLVSRSAGGSGKAFFDTVTGGLNGSQGMDLFARGEPFTSAVATGGSGGGGCVIGSPLVRAAEGGGT